MTTDPAAPGFRWSGQPVLFVSALAAVVVPFGGSVVGVKLEAEVKRLEQTRAAAHGELHRLTKTGSPAAVGGVAQGPLPDELCEWISEQIRLDPLQWILIAEASRRLNAEQPLLASANTWFED